MASAAPSSSTSTGETVKKGSGGRRRFTVDALFTDHRPQAVGVTDLPTAKEIQLDRIEPDPDQPRRTFDEEKLGELAASIQIEGVLQPIVVRYDEPRDIYVIVHGERRWRACRQAGLAAIPAIVREVPADRRLIQQLMENIVRDDLNAIDRAAALRALKSQLGEATWDQVAEAVGIRRSRLFQLLGTEKLPDRVQDDIRAGRLSEKQSRALQGLPPGQQEALREAIIERELSAEDAMRLARRLKGARLPDDYGAAAEALTRFRTEPVDADDASPTNDAGLLLAAIAAAATGSRAERKALTAAAKAAKARPYRPERLQTEVLAIAKTLSRARGQDLAADTPAFKSLAALRDTLDALLQRDLREGETGPYGKK
jgi:ParB family chromosome partitioning protein